MAHAADASAAAVASGRHWRLAIDSIECNAAESALRIGARVHYLGPRGLVEAPLNRLVDGKGVLRPPKSLVWKKGGDPQHAKWLPAGGVRDLKPGTIGEFQFRYDLAGTTGELKLEFGDIRSFALTRNACGGVLKPGQLQTPQAPRLGNEEGAKSRARVYRLAYPCRPQKGELRTVEAQYPPHLPRQLLLFGRGYLPNARQIELPMGAAPAQSYAYSGADDLTPIEDAARRALAADFPAYADGRKYFTFNWGAQKAQSGNDVYSVGIYEIRPCA